MARTRGTTLLAVHASRFASLSATLSEPDPTLLAEVREMGHLLYYILVGTGDLVHDDARRAWLLVLLQTNARPPPTLAAGAGSATGMEGGQRDAVDNMVRVLEIEQVFFAQWRAMQMWLNKCKCPGCEIRLSSAGQGIRCSRYVRSWFIRTKRHSDRV